MSTVNASAVNDAPILATTLATTTTANGGVAQRVVRGTVNGAAVGLLSVGGSRTIGTDEGHTPGGYFDAIGVVVRGTDGVSSTRKYHYIYAVAAATSDVLRGTTTSRLEDVASVLDSYAATGQFNRYTSDTTTLLDVLEGSRGSNQEVESAIGRLVSVQGVRGRYESAVSSLTAYNSWDTLRTVHDDVVGAAVSKDYVVSAGVQLSHTSTEEVQAVGNATRQVRTTNSEADSTGVGSSNVPSTRAHHNQGLTDLASITGSIPFETRVRLVRDTLESAAALSAHLVGAKLSALAMYEDVPRLLSEVGLSPTGEAWVFNVSNLAMSRYKGYAAMQVVSTQEGPLAATLDGLAVTDENKSLPARVQWGVGNLGTPQLKRLRHVYFTAAGTKALKVVTRSGYGQALDSTTYERPLDGTRVPTVYRVDLARGQRAPMWGFELVADADTNATVLDQRAVVLVDDRRV